MTTYSPNVPLVAVGSDVVVEDVNDIFLVEFENDSGVREVFFNPEEGTEQPLATALGLRLHRVIAPGWKLVAQYDAQTDSVPLDFMQNRETAIFASARPGTPYSWQLLQVTAPTEGAPFMAVTGSRLATDEESAVLDSMYPKWLEKSAAFDAHAASLTAETQHSSVVVPPPELSQ